MEYKNFPLVSIVVPTYNQAKYLEACLDSIMFQNYPNIEIIVVADPGSDNTFDILDNYEKQIKNEKVVYVGGYDEKTDSVIKIEELKYPQRGRRLITVKNKKRLGHSASYNFGFKLAKGEFCTYVASDDIILPHMISTLIEPLIKDEADFAYSDMFVIDDNMRILRHIKLPEYNFISCFCKWYFCGVSKLYKRKLHEKYGYFNENYIANDYECYLRFALNGVKFKHIPEVLYLVRTHENRNVGVHSQDNHKKMLSESCKLAKIARKSKKLKNDS